ncbi:HAD-IIA family hydrolase [Sporosarcina sp. FSL K6-3508]|uniref:HAD-IIA family hydrolase n=1 Tax=Sporosarcina sp. FSL K6-3508 TaxID=2921557 RepID=UPI00315A17B4
MILPNDFDAYCFDLDGTIYLGDKLLPGVKETIHIIRKTGKKVLFITNSPTLTREEGKIRLEQMGIATELEEILTAPYLAGSYFSVFEPDATVFIIGEEAIRTELRNFSIQTTEDPMKATHVLTGMDRSFTYDDLQFAMDAVRNCRNFIITNPDPSCPVPSGFIPDTLSLAKAIEVASGQKINKVLGKPDKFYSDQMVELLGVERQKILVIGDRLDTDIQLGIAQGFATCLVLTGISKEADMENTGIRPDYVIENMKYLFRGIDEEAMVKV